MIQLRDEVRSLKQTVLAEQAQIAALEQQSAELDAEIHDQESLLNTASRLKGLVRSSSVAAAPRFDRPEQHLVAASADARVSVRPPLSDFLQIAAQDALVNLRLQGQILKERKRRLQGETAAARAALANYGVDAQTIDPTAAQDRLQQVPCFVFSFNDRYSLLLRCTLS